MAKAVWGGAVIADSERTEVVERNHYFPPDTVNWEYLQPSLRTSVCPWKGTASYYDVVVGGEANPAAAWQYREPKPAAAHIKDHVAFWNGVEVQAPPS